ncbi:uncharacterized protein FYW49_018249 [Xenentodon cancila]
MKIYAILDVRETDQTFISYVWIYLRWDNEHIWWQPEKFCGIKHILVPTQMLWMPDLTIEEMTEKDKASPSPYFNVQHHGWVEFRNDEVVMSTCRMHVFKFPFDIQTCNLSFKSIMYPDQEVKLYYKNDTDITELTRETLQTQYEWLFLSMSVKDKTVNHFGFNQTVIIYTIKMKRRSVLYIANFLLPVFFFLCLDLASLLMSDSGGEKIGFKITVLLAVTVMQLILHDILPSSSDRIPLIAVYCIGIFALILLSLLETMLVMHLIDKDNKTDIKQRVNNEQVDKQSNFNNRLKAGAREGSSSQHREVSLVLEKVSDELEEIRKTVALLSSKKDDEMPGYWSRLAEKINKVELVTAQSYKGVRMINRFSVRVSQTHQFLGLTRSSDLFTMSRPVSDHKARTDLYLEMVIFAILDMEWDNHFTAWDKDKFCGISNIVVPLEALWKPDITIEEMIEKDKAPPSPYLRIHHNKAVEYKNDQVVISTCKMHVYKFPFDIQSCNISFKSILYADEELRIDVHKNNTAISQWSREHMLTQYEWLFINMTVTTKTDDYLGFNQTSIVYTITMKRRANLYVANFLLPVLFFLCLDLASFLIPDNGGEKLSFKVTVMLAITVMQLILNDILPSSSDRIPIIAIYCIGIFAVMLLSLLETVLVMYLIEKDSESPDSETGIDKSLTEEQDDNKSKQNFISCCTEIKFCQSASVDDTSADQTPCLAKQDSSSHLTEVSLVLEKVSDELGEMKKTMALLSNRKEDKKPGSWTKLAKKINKVFLIFYVIAVSLFLPTIFSVWILAPE